MLSDITLHYEYVLINVAQLVADLGLLFEGVAITIEEFGKMDFEQSDKFGFIC